MFAIKKKKIYIYIERVKGVGGWWVENKRMKARRRNKRWSRTNCK